MDSDALDALEQLDSTMRQLNVAAAPDPQSSHCSELAVVEEGASSPAGSVSSVLGLTEAGVDGVHVRPNGTIAASSELVGMVGRSNGTAPRYMDQTLFPDDEKYEVFAKCDDGVERPIKAHPQWTTGDMKMHLLDMIRAEEVLAAHAHSVKATKYMSGEDGHVQNWRLAIEEFVLAHQAGDPSASYNLYVAYSGLPEAQDYGIKPNNGKALKYLMAAAKGEHALSQFTVGRFYYNGERGHQKDFGKAQHWWLKASGNGEVHAMQNLGVMYYKRELPCTDNVAEACKWLKMAALHGHEPAKINYRRILMSLKGDRSIGPPPEEAPLNPDLERKQLKKAAKTQSKKAKKNKKK